MPRIASRIGSGIAEHLASTWVLLSDTTNFLSRTSAFEHYESQLRELRSRLSASTGRSEAIKEIKKELIELREALRLQGYDLSLGAMELSIKGFRNDAATAEGFRRLVIFIGERGLWFLAGEDNHIALDGMLDAECLRRGFGPVLHKHYLWYRWSHNLLLLSGSDTETAEDFERLQAWGSVPENALRLLGKMKKCR